MNFVASRSPITRHCRRGTRHRSRSDRRPGSTGASPPREVAAESRTAPEIDWNLLGGVVTAPSSSVRAEAAHSRESGCRYGGEIRGPVRGNSAGGTVFKGSRGLRKFRKSRWLLGPCRMMRPVNKQRPATRQCRIDGLLVPVWHQKHAFTQAVISTNQRVGILKDIIANSYLRVEECRNDAGTAIR